MFCLGCAASSGRAGARWLAMARGVGQGCKAACRGGSADGGGVATDWSSARPVRFVPLSSPAPPWLRLRARRFRLVAPPRRWPLGARVSAAPSVARRIRVGRRRRSRPAARRRVQLPRRSLPRSSLRARLAARRALARSTALARLATLQSVATPPPSALPPLQAALHP